jgi:hypothetical protein
VHTWSTPPSAHPTRSSLEVGKVSSIKGATIVYGCIDRERLFFVSGNILHTLSLVSIGTAQRFGQRGAEYGCLWSGVCGVRASMV